MTKIIREGHFYRAVNTETGFRSAVLTSASQAGLVISRKFGRAAYDAAVADFIKNQGR